MTNIILFSLHSRLLEFSKPKAISADIAGYLTTVEEILIKKNPSSLFFVFVTFKDDKKLYFTFTQVKLLIEQYYTEDYVCLVLKHIHILAERAPEWVCTILLDITNTPYHLAKLQSQIHNDNYSYIYRLLEGLEKRSKSHKDFSHELRLRLSIRHCKVVENG